MKDLIIICICSLSVNIYGQNWNILLSNINKSDSAKVRQLVDEVTDKPDIEEFKIPSNVTDSIKNIIEQKNDSLYKIKSLLIDKRVRAINALSENYLYLNNLNIFSGILITSLWKEYRYDKNIRLILASLNLSKSQRDSLLNFSGSEILVKAKLGELKYFETINKIMNKAIEDNDEPKIQDCLVQILYINNNKSIKSFLDVLLSKKILEYKYEEGDYTYHKKITLSYYSLLSLWEYNPHLKLFSPNYYQEYLRQKGINKALFEEYTNTEWELYISAVNSTLSEIFRKNIKINVPFLISGIYPIDPSDIIQ